MNDKRRKRLREAVKMLDHAWSIVELAQEEEEDGMDNMPENLQSSERYEKMEEAADALSDAMEKIGEAIEQIRAAI